MAISTRSSKRMSARRTSREDGDATKAKIIEAAGKLFAERGYAETTSKDICERVGINLAAVNYHFGSRDGLYQEVLTEVKKYMFDVEALHRLTRSEMRPEEKLNHFIDRLVETVFARDSWQVRIWAREMVSPTGFAIFEDPQHALTKFGMIATMFSDMTGIPAESQTLHYIIHNVMSQFMVMLIVGQHDCGPHQIVFNEGPACFAKTTKMYIFTVLEAFKQKYATDPASLESLCPCSAEAPHSGANGGVPEAN